MDWGKLGEVLQPSKRGFFDGWKRAGIFRAFFYQKAGDGRSSCSGHPLIPTATTSVRPGVIAEALNGGVRLGETSAEDPG